MNELVDLKNGVVAGLSIPPQDANANVNGSAVDLINGEKRTQAIISLGALDANTVFYVTIQESDANNANFAALTDTTNSNTGNLNTANAVTLLSFQRSKRYLRAVATIAGTNAAGEISCVILEQKKDTGNAAGFSLSPAG